MAGPDWQTGLMFPALVLAAAVSSTATVDRVLLISVDGLRGDALEKLGPKRTPNLHRLLREGAGTTNARTDPERTYTVPNHVCMVTGRPAGGRSGHGVVLNQFNGQTIHAFRQAYVASLFGVVHDHGRRVALVAGKDKFRLFGQSYDGRHGAADRIPPDHGRRKIDQVSISNLDDDRSIEVTMRLLQITRPPGLIFLHLAGPDVIGHGTGWESAAYFEEVAAADRRLGRLLFAIGARRSLRSSTAIILTSDHGGVDNSHLDATRLDNHRVPFLVWGPGVAAGADLYALNTAREDPKTAPKGDRPPIRNCDAGNLALKLLALPPIPGSVMNRDQKLRVQ